MLLFYIRHGDPIYDPDSLTPLGQEQAGALAKRLLLCKIDRVYSSPSTRARMTAEPFCQLTRKEMTICDWADEGLAGRDFYIKTEEGHGWCFQHPAMVKLFNSPAIRNLGERWYEHPDLQAFTFAAGIRRVNEAVDNFLLTLGLRHDRENSHFEVVGESPERVALFAHQGFGMAFLPTIIGIPYPEFATRFDISHTSVTVIEFANDGGFAYPQILTLSNDSHLFRDGLPTKYINRIYF